MRLRRPWTADPIGPEVAEVPVFPWRSPRRPFQRLLIGFVALAVLVVSAWIHAWACTGGQPTWRSVAPTTQP